MTDRLRSYRAAMKVIGNAERQETGCWLKNRAENSHQPFRQRERAKANFRSVKLLQKFASIHSSVYNQLPRTRQRPETGLRRNWSYILGLLVVVGWIAVRASALAPEAWHHPLWDSAANTLGTDISGQLSHEPFAN